LTIETERKKSGLQAEKPAEMFKKVCVVPFRDICRENIAVPRNAVPGFTRLKKPEWNSGIPERSGVRQGQKKSGARLRRFGFPYIIS
jgi:hypothetical protein